jgi:hypothetical protein
MPSHEYQITPDNLQRRHHGRENPRAREAAKKAVREADRAEAEPCQSELRVTADRRNHPQRSRNASMAAKVGCRSSAVAAKPRPAFRLNTSTGRSCLGTGVIRTSLTLLERNQRSAQTT